MSLPTLKREDLQCWRALSILAVLLFHIWPEHFPNGYLGVDIFFVLSGYLMASLYSFNTNIFLSIADFYYRRIRRIVPFYMIIILATLLFLSQQIYPESYILVVEDSKWAIAFATNYEDLLKNREYFESESTFRFFKHCWSLAVEMQFYLLFPFIAISENYISLRKYQLLLLSILNGSAFYQIFSTNQIIQYESLFCRIWQFCVGMLAETLPISSINVIPSIILLTISAMVFCPIILPRLIISFVTIFASAGIISVSTTDFHPFKTIIRFSTILKYISHLGDISYVLYLIHWPLITYAKFLSSVKVFSYFARLQFLRRFWRFDFKLKSAVIYYWRFSYFLTMLISEGFLLLMTSIFISKIVHIVIERPIIKLCNSYRKLAICLILLYASSIYLPSKTPQKVSFSTIENLKPSNLTLAFWKEISENFTAPLVLPPKWTKENDLEFAVKIRGLYMGYPFHCKEEKIISLKKTRISYCEVEGLNPNGTLVALSIGNSFSMNIISAVSSHQSFKKVINVYASAGSFPIHDELETYLIENVIKQIKPDVILLVQRYYDENLYKTPINDIEENKEFKHWNKVLKEISNYTSAIIINKEQIEFPYDISQEYIRKKFYGLPIETKLKKPPASPNLEEWLKSLDCRKCGFFGYREAFCEGEMCQIMDLSTDLPLFRDQEHISPIGVRYIKPLIDKEINRILNISVSF